jgi:hypothetical protein
MNNLFEPFSKLICVLLLMAISFGFGIWLVRNRTFAPTRANSMGPTVIQLEKLGELTTTRVHVTDVLSSSSVGYRGSWLISGDALLSCDVSKATLVDLNTEARTATIRMPPLRVITARVNHDKTKTWSVERTSWLPWQWGDQGQGIMRDAAMFHAQQLIETAAGAERHLSSAKAQAELLIQRMYQFIEWNVSVEWE